MLKPVIKLDYCTAQENNAAFWMKDRHGSGANGPITSGGLIYCIGIDLGGDPFGRGVEHQRHPPDVGLDRTLHLCIIIDVALAENLATVFSCQSAGLEKLCGR